MQYQLNTIQDDVLNFKLCIFNTEDNTVFSCISLRNISTRSSVSSFVVVFCFVLFCLFFCLMEVHQYKNIISLSREYWKCEFKSKVKVSLHSELITVKVISHLSCFHITWLINTRIYMCRSLLEKRRISDVTGYIPTLVQSTLVIKVILICWSYTRSSSMPHSWAELNKWHVIWVCSSTTSPQVVALDWVFTDSPLSVPNDILYRLLTVTTICTISCILRYNVWLL